MTEIWVVVGTGRLMVERGKICFVPGGYGLVVHRFRAGRYVDWITVYVDELQKTTTLELLS